MAWARLGDSALTRSLEGEHKRALVFSLLARARQYEAQVQGLADAAKAAARRIPEPPRSVLALAALGETDRAEAAAHTIDSHSARAQTLILVARQTGTDRGARLESEVEFEARTCRDPLQKAQTLAAIAEVSAAAGNANYVRLLVAQAQTAADLVERKDYKHVYVLRTLRRLLAAIDEGGPASSPTSRLEAAEAEARGIDHIPLRARELAVVAARWADAGAVDRGRLLAVEAETIATTHVLPTLRTQNMERLAEAWNEAGELDTAEAAARSVTDPSVSTFKNLVRRAAEPPNQLFKALARVEPGALSVLTPQ